jgi:uncharacterized protein
MIWLWMLFIGFIGVLLWAFFVEPNWHRLRRVSLPNQKKLNKPITILHLSDIHFVKSIGFKHYFFQKLSMLNPDLIVVTGDVIDTNGGIETAKKYLSGLRARFGTYLVLGNHDYYDYHAKDNLRYYFGGGRKAPNHNDLERFIKAMEDIGIRVLVNDSLKIDVHGTPVLIAGTDDPVTQRVDFEKTLHDLSPKTFNLLLMHQLDGVLMLSHKGVDLVLSGHTHGGQIRLPFLGPIYCDTRLPRKYVNGLNDYKGMNVFVSHGMGQGRFLRPRLFCRPEAAWFEITP